MQRHAAISGWGSYLPERIVTNQDLEALVDTSDDWIRTRTGICQRHVAGPGETTSTMCAKAAERALACASLSAADVELVICATTTPDCLLPATGCLVQKRIGAARAGAFDVNSACTGFLQGMIVGAQFIQAGTCERVLVVAGETLSRFLNWKDRDTCVLFGDGAGAVVLEATDQDYGVLSTVFGCRGDAGHLLAIEGGGSAKPASAQTLASGAHCVSMRGNEVFKLAVRSMSQAATEVLNKASVSVSSIRKMIPHQANVRIIRAVQDALALPTEKVLVNIAHCGNTGSASVAIALAGFLAEETVQPGDNLLLVAFGGGLTWAAALYCWADVEAIVSRRHVDCPSEKCSDLEERRRWAFSGPPAEMAEKGKQE
jgi:3-oxoacyl-[acyl-carrier-protein] synthase-3